MTLNKTAPRNVELHADRGPGVCRAFTLVELMVAVAIIALLGIISLPVYRSIRTTTLSTTCVSNLRQIGVGIAGYMAENNQFFPGNCSSTEISNTRYPHLIGPYMGSSKRSTDLVTNPNDGSQETVLRDPDAYLRAEFHSPATPPEAYKGKALNATLGIYGANPNILPSDRFRSSIRLLAIERPSATVLLAEKYAGNPSDLKPSGGGAVLSLTGPFPDTAAGPAANIRTDRNPKADAKGGGPCTFLFADMHVERINLETLRAPAVKAWPGTITFKVQGSN